MITNPHPGNGTLSVSEPFPSEMEVQKMRKALSELYELLEEYSPRWYPERLRNDVRSMLQTDRK